MSISLYLKESSTPGAAGKKIGTITDEQLATLVDLLEEENEGDHDYYVDRDILDFLQEEGADADLIKMLEPHLPQAEGEGIEVEWKKE
jgi:hypothetical protein